MSGVDEGVLHITAVDAHITHSTQTFGKMDPYVKFFFREQEWKTKVHNNGGKNPHWNESHDFQVHYLGDDIKFEVWDDEVGRDNKIGQGVIKASALATHGGIDEWFVFHFDDEEAGKLHLKSQWHPKEAGHHHHH